MPTYEYECRSCHHRFERREPMSARISAPCPRCTKRSKRLISGGAGLLFKGTGFYITDHRSSDYKKQAAAEAPPKGPPPSKADSPSSVASKADPPKPVADKSAPSKKSKGAS